MGTPRSVVGRWALRIAVDALRIGHDVIVGCCCDVLIVCDDVFIVGCDVFIVSATCSSCAGTFSGPPLKSLSLTKGAP